MEVRELSEDEYKIWDELVDTSPYGTIFHKSYWLSICGQAVNRKPTIYGCLESGRLIGGCPLYVGGSRFFRWADSAYTGIHPYGGVVFAQYQSDSVRKREEFRQNIIRCLCQQFTKIGFHYIRIVNSPEVFDVRPFIWNGWESRVHYAYYFDVCGDVDNVISKGIRWAKKNAAKMNVETSKLETPDARAHYDLLSMTLERQNIIPRAGEKFFHDILMRLKAEGSGEMWIAKTPSGDIASTEIVIWDNKRTYRWSAASHTDFRRMGATPLLLCEILRDLKQRGFRTIDLMGGMVPQLAKFVAGFNPNLVPYYSVDRKTSLVKMGTIVRDLVSGSFTHMKQSSSSLDAFASRSKAVHTPLGRSGNPDHVSD